MAHPTKDPGAQGYPENPRECGHHKLDKVDASGVNDVDTDVLVYLCRSCGKTFTVTDL